VSVAQVIENLREEWRTRGTRTPNLLVRSQWSKMLNALFGVAYELETPFFPHLAAPNPAPKTELYRTYLAWESAVKTLKSASEPEIPPTLERKERAGHDAPPAAALDRFECEWS
jgi:hypothetical protein